VLVHSQVVADELRALASPKSVVVTPMPSLIPLEPTPLPPRPPLKLLFLGFVRPYKGLDDGLAALKILVERGMNVELTVAGEFWEPVDTWRRRVSELGLAERVHLRPGYASDAEVAELLASHHAVLAPYRSATQSGVVPLAFAAGRPVVATAVGGIPERIVDGGPAGNGVLSPPRDPSALAVAIERVGQGLEQLATGARAGAVGWSAVGDDLLRALAPPG
jgi:glycosyltransferase involved in cell wall biosynthesis